MKRIIRVFPRKTKATPTDGLAAVNRLPDLFDRADEVHVSVAFTYDLPRAEELAAQWKHVAPVTIGGPATGQPSGEFTPGMYIRKGYTITSRGCPNRCWFCNVWRREGSAVRELPITDGWNILDDNLLACSEQHIRAVFAMLARQNERPILTGGLEAKLLKPWHVDLLRSAKPERVFFAYDTPDDYEPLRYAAKMMKDGGFNPATHHRGMCYVLCGHKSDTFDKAEKRMTEVLDLSLTPMAMLFRDKHGIQEKQWEAWTRQWARPSIIHAKKKASR